MNKKLTDLANNPIAQALTAVGLVAALNTIPVQAAQPTHHCTPARVGWVVPLGTHEDEVPLEVYFSYPHAKQVTVFSLQSFEHIEGTDNTFQVTYEGCI